MLHDVVEDTDYTLDFIEKEFGKTVANICDGLTKIRGVFTPGSSLQSENFSEKSCTILRNGILNIQSKHHKKFIKNDISHRNLDRFLSEFRERAPKYSNSLRNSASLVANSPFLLKPALWPSTFQCFVCSPANQTILG